MAEGNKSFQWYDYVIFVSTLAISLGIGLYHAFAGGRQKTTKEYLMGNRNLGVLPVGLSMFMSYISAILVLGNSAETYTRGVQQWLASVGSSMAVVGTCVFFVPLFFPLKLTSSFEYLEMRFKSRLVRLTGTLLLMLSQILYMGIAMFSPATALEAATGIKTWISIVATGFVATVYTTLGGMKAVVWTDVFQAFVMLGGLISVLIAGVAKVGGISEVWNISMEGGRLNMFKWYRQITAAGLNQFSTYKATSLIILVGFDPNPLVRMSFWSVVIGRFISSTQTMGTGQTSVQRYCALPTANKGRLSVLLNIPCMLVVYTLTSLLGLTVYAYYTKIGCDPLRTNKISSSNQILPFFIVNDLGTPALPGLFVAVLFSGALSSLSSSLNSLAAITWKDLLENRFGHITEERKALVNKVLVGIFGVIAIGVAFLAQIFGGHVLQASQSFVSGVAGPLLGVFILGAFFPCANWKGAFVGAWAGLAMSMTMTIGAYLTKPYRELLPTVTTNCSMLTPPWNITKPIPTNPENVFPLFRVSFMWFASTATITSVVVGFVVSLITGPTKPSDQDPRLVIPVFDRFLCCLPISWLKACWCGVRHDEVKLDESGHYPERSDQDDSSSRKTMELQPQEDNTKIQEAKSQVQKSQDTASIGPDKSYDNSGYTGSFQSVSL